MLHPCLRAGVTVALLQLAALAVVSAQQPISPPVRPNFPVTLSGSGPVQVTQPAVGDLDNDGRKEIVVGTKGRQLWVVNADGTILTALHVVDGANHAFEVLKRSGRTDEEVREELVRTIEEWCRALAAARETI